jgi:hypothetical protein
MKGLVFIVLLLVAISEGIAATASGRNWRLSIDSLECRAGVMTLGTRIRYLGPKGPVEAPVIQVVDEKGARHVPKSLVWKQGSKPVADWLSGGGLTNLQSADVGEVQLRFELREAAGELRLEFGDIRAFALTRSGRRSGCEGMLGAERLRTPGQPRRLRAEEAKSDLRVYRALYPCRSRSEISVITDAEYPPYPPQQLLVLGRGYLPNAREIALPMGSAPAQSYTFSGTEDRKAVEALARRFAAADFPQYGNANHFAYDWGLQRSASGNEIWSVGIYDLRACPASQTPQSTRIMPTR